MDKKQLFQHALSKLRHHFPSELAGITSLSVHDWNDESGLNDLFEDLLALCKSDSLKGIYAEQVNNLYALEHGQSAGVGMANARLEIRCRALILSLEHLG
jgi:hypothetical protein